MSMATGWSMKKRQMKAKGGEVKGDGPASTRIPVGKRYPGAKRKLTPEDEQKLHTHYKARDAAGVRNGSDEYNQHQSAIDAIQGTGFAEGGEVEDHGDESEAHMLDMVGRIMKNHYSKGGEVANDTGEGQEADELPNQFDDLVLRDDMEDDHSAGNEEGSDLNQEDEGDMISKIMGKRRK